ncbi:MAG: hypothetical protein LAQ69_35965, partial [Acidobacteriia bacterium]|nr:hypothetical protein [Terriglobia bacterium]
NDEATQVLGVTLPMVDRRGDGVYAEQETMRLTGSFEQLFRSLADGRPEFLARESDGSKLPGAYEFPREFRKIRPAVVQFLVDLCRPSQLTVGPFLRGFYFTGVRPVIVNESAPVSAAVPEQQAYGAPAGATGIFNRTVPAGPAAGPAAPAPVIGTRKVPQWLFLAHLFNDILLADRGALGASGASTKTSTGRRWLYIAAASLCFLLTVFFTISFFNNKAIENRVLEAAHGIPPGEVAGPDFAPTSSLQKLDVLRQSLVTLLGYQKDGSPWLYRWELYVGDDVYRAARPVYCSDFRQLLLKQTQGNMLAYLRNLQGTNAEYGPAYEALRSYLITTSNPEKSDSQLAPALMRFWLNDRTTDPDRQALARKQFDFYQQDLLAESPCASSPDGRTVASARAYLKSQGSTQRVYLAMLAAANKKFMPINFNRSFPGSEKAVVDPYEVKGAFSKDGWKFMNDAISHPDRYVKGEAWVLGDTGSENIDLGKLSTDIKSLYSSDWVKEWTAYIRGASVLRYAGLKDAAVKLRQHSSNLAPLLQLSSQASQNTAVDDPIQAKIFQPVQYVTPSNIIDVYVSGPNQAYISALMQLQSAIESIADQPTPNEQAIAQTLQVANQAKGTVGQMSTNFDIHSPIMAMVQKLLTDPITYATDAFPKPATELNNKGGALCAQFRGLLNKYPFNLSSSTDATVDDVNRVFRKPDGALWKFYDENNLAKLLQKQGNTYVAVSGGAVNLTPQFVTFFNLSAGFSEALYANGAQDPKFTYSLKAVPTDAVVGDTLHIDGQTLTYTQGAPLNPQQFVWQGTGTHGVTATVKFGGQDVGWAGETGLWAAFRFFNAAESWQPSATGQTLEWVVRVGKTVATVDGKPLTVRFDLQMGAVPFFTKGYLSRLGCVAPVAR